MDAEKAGSRKPDQIRDLQVNARRYQRGHHQDGVKFASPVECNRRGDAVQPRQDKNRPAQSGPAPGRVTARQHDGRNNAHRRGPQRPARQPLSARHPGAARGFHPTSAGRGIGTIRFVIEVVVRNIGS